MANNISELWKRITVDNKTNCWRFNVVNKVTGYGEIWIRAHRYSAHRLAYVLKKGDIPEGLQIDHLCRVRSCINPDHLELVTIKENLLRGMSFSGKNSRKTHCNYGHEFSEENTWVGNSKKRICRICQSKRRRAYYRKTYVNDPIKRHKEYLRRKVSHL